MPAAVLARALRALGDDEDADLELPRRAGRVRRLGARLGRRGRRSASTRDVEERRAAARRPRDGRSCSRTSSGRRHLAEALGDVAWERLLRWHDDTLRGRSSATPWRDRSSTRPATASSPPSRPPGRRIDAAIAIQRALRDQRDATASRSPVRIGLHTAEANRAGRTTAAIGVHVAARVGALAGAGEILATAETLEEAGEPVASDAREVAVKGVTVPLQVAGVSWA